jgi:hypothetical protein
MSAKVKGNANALVRNGVEYFMIPGLHQWFSSPYLHVATPPRCPRGQRRLRRNWLVRERSKTPAEVLPEERELQSGFAPRPTFLRARACAFGGSAKNIPKFRGIDSLLLNVLTDATQNCRCDCADDLAGVVSA